MCGISGVVQVGGGVEAELIEGLGDSLFHRGPDQGGTYLVSEGALGVGFATRRLAILDLSPNGSQPMQTPDGTLCIAYNGEVYNEPELRRDLEARGYRFRSTGDTETVLYAYDADGPAAFEDLNGMFALALHDRRRDEVVLARDRMGIKPLYYTWDGQRLAFASELRTLVRQLGLPVVPDPAGLELYLALGYVPSPRSLIRGVQKLPPGSYLTLGAGGQLRLQQFWRPTYSAPGRHWREAEAAAAVRETVVGAVERQMRSDVPVGVLLSGGVDSTIIATTAARLTDHPLDTFSIAFESEASPIEPAYNADAQFARRVAETIGARHHEIVLDDRTDLPSLLRRLVVGLDEAVWELSFVSIYLMSRLAREHGVTVLLTGDGSDELFAGYPWIAAAERQELYERLPGLTTLLPVLARVVPNGSVLREHAFNLLATLGRSDLERYAYTHTIFDQAERRALVGGAGAGAETALAAVVTPLLDGARGGARGDRIALLDLALWVREHFNQRVDRMTMLNSVEARVPFQDNAVVDLALRLPAALKARRGQPKRLLKAAFRQDLPEFVLRRPKRPFAAPAWAWSVGALRGFAHEVLAPERVRAAGVLDPDQAARALAATETAGAREDRQTARSWQKLWTLLMLQLWLEELRAAPAPAADEAASQIDHVLAPAAGSGR